MKKLLIVLAACLSAILILGACGNTNDTKEDSGQGGNEETQEDKRVVQHMRGETEIPENLDRVLSLRPSFSDHILALDEKPYGVTGEEQYGGGYIPYLAEQLEGAEIVGNQSSIDLEKVLSLDPDLILIDDYLASEIYDELEKIAPTIVLGTEDEEERNSPDYWQQDFMKIAEIYGKTDLAQEKIDELNADVDAAKEKISSLEDKKLAFLRIRKDAIQLYAQSGHPMNTLLYNDLGFEPSDLTDPEERKDLSLEVIPEMKADYVFLQVDSSGGPDNLSSMEESPLWSNLEAVKNDRVEETDFWIYKSWGVIGRNQMVEEVQGYIEQE
ncbi:iron-siderophore ABC transporter substrate-binding protein [Rossellomorea vietnamensis]|uniref:Iron-siderophore ABC transporter substrate-binding protein n=2 Tax=Rossellomorea TaxID=2837508 RepID=A0A5D4KAF5_9BACI|nr:MULTISPECIES: iron-siderophore ABC transporter substrate-binding protein [Rossellomorea]TYR74337.1 iron-siderophore ABC transporter substrate-binding protein [Rossellomorea vietnamensis]TYS77050.1 iron-siderophore ABC transporter substrate-binding protein [Rossellomorea aquimaris]